MPTYEVLRHLQAFERSSGIPRDQIRVLDFGCGRGRLVARLRAVGYSVFGTDVAPDRLEAPKPLLRNMGFDPDEIVRLAGDGDGIPFADGHFDFVSSTDVLEHVVELDRAAAELWRVMKPAAVGLHLYPSHLSVVEGHLFMPFVHWLPKSALRRAWIKACMLVGMTPGWEKLKGRGLEEQVAVYYQYSVEKTWYRSPARMLQAFHGQGFEAQYISADHSGLARLGQLRSLLRFEPVWALMNYLLTNFYRAELLVHKPPLPTTAAERPV